MDNVAILDFSRRLKEVARDLSFLGHPRYPIKELNQLFPQHKTFIQELVDVSVPFNVNTEEKRVLIENLLQDLSKSTLPIHYKKIFTQRIQDYLQLVIMIENFGSILFYNQCIKLYGSSKKTSMNETFHQFLEKIPPFCLPDLGEKKLDGEQAMEYLRIKMLETFEVQDFEVKASTSLLSDSSAGRKTLKLNPFKKYSTGQLDIFLVHEGWVHLGTSINGGAQTDNIWLSTWAPRTTFMQEGLAIVTELITGNMSTERWNKVVLRHLATCMAEKGSPITEVYSYLRHQDMEALDAFKLALRVFRGVPLEGGMAFTKELLYLHGMAELLYHLHVFQTDLRSVWVGKTSFEEHAILLKHWESINPKLKYFPKELESDEANLRLEKLKNLSVGLFNHGSL